LRSSPKPIANRRERRRARPLDSQHDEALAPRRWWTYAKNLFPILFITALPIARSANLIANLWDGNRARAWDGTGHFALAQIYNQSIFPDTFGWTHAYFAGMPFPNFYPPLFYWCVGVLGHAHILSFVTAFKLVLITPVFLLPAAVWLLAFTLSQRDKIVASAAAIAILPMLIDYHLLHPVGLNHQGTFLIGLYSQPLGFVLLVVWYVVYTRSQRVWHFSLAAILLALTILANFFGAVVAALLVATTLIEDLVRWYRTTNTQESRERRNTFLLNLGSPLVALSLTLFWVVPMLSEYAYFVTRPQASPLNELVPPVMWVWYLLAVLGIWQWVKRPTPSMRPFLCTCFLLASSIVLATLVSPRWFPLQTPRFLSMLNFLLAVPVGFAVRAGLIRLAKAVSENLSGEKKILSRNERKIAARAGKRKPAWLETLSRAPVTISVASVLVIVVFISSEPADYAYVFYKTEGSEQIDGVLSFARDHRDGRYLVEVPFASRPDAALDGRAINSFLGAQGNETLSVVFREASPSSVFFNPLASAFAESPDNFGISTVLADDLDFVQQPLERHIDRARFIGVRYLVIATLWIKNFLIQQDTVGPRHDFGVWSVFELREWPPNKVRVLPYKPALVVSNFSLKERRSNEYDFVRWAEEQFNDDWFDVLLVRSPESKIERLSDLANFGALILDTYDYVDENAAFEVLRRVAQSRPLILLSSDNELFHRILSARSEFPFVQIVQRQATPAGQPLNALKPANHYGSSPIREEWRAIRHALERAKTPTPEGVRLSGDIRQDTIRLNYQDLQSTEAVPVLVATTYHPNWRRSDGGAVYAATPFFMLTFMDKSVSLTYGRRSIEKLALWTSTLSLLCLFTIMAWRYRRVISDLGRSRSPDLGAN
jgi:hypothetical protein